jgi:uncharacterized membrane protein YeaQ/YmgE (transglycosylase-associated protein family)
MIGWILFGLFVGIVAKLLMPGKDPGGFIITILLGIGGALVGGYLGRSLGWYEENDPVGFMMAVSGAVLLLIGYRYLLAPKAACRTAPTPYTRLCHDE